MPDDLVADILAMPSQTDQAIEECQLALSANPKPGLVYPHPASNYASKGKYGHVIENFRKALPADSTLPGASIGMRKVLEALRKPVEALKSYRQARCWEEPSPASYHAEASHYISLGQYDSAFATLDLGRSKCPDDALLLSDPGLCHLRADKIGSAIVYLEKALSSEQMLTTTRNQRHESGRGLKVRQQTLTLRLAISIPFHIHILAFLRVNQRLTIRP